MDRALGNLVQVALRHGNYDARLTSQVSEARALTKEWSPQLVLFDLDKHEAFGDVVKNGGARRPPAVLAFTRKRDTSVKLKAFDRGVDDIIEVPFTLDEIVARSFALMRRFHDTSPKVVAKIQLDSLSLDVLEQRVAVDGLDLALTPVEQSLLYLLAANAGQVLTRNAVMDSIWGAEFETESNVIDRHVRELRVKLGDDWRQPKYIETVPGKGYRFIVHTAKGGK